MQYNIVVKLTHLMNLVNVTEAQNCLEFFCRFVEWNRRWASRILFQLGEPKEFEIVFKVELMFE
jgi:hypothetical protein